MKKMKFAKIIFKEAMDAKKAYRRAQVREEVIDNYRWLEDDNAKETKNWVVEQNETKFTVRNLSSCLLYTSPSPRD